MGVNSELQPTTGYGLEQVRGIMTNRGIQQEVTPDGRTIGGVFDKLGLSIDELRGKKLLDVGTGRGKTIREGRKLGLDILGVDLAPVISLDGEDRFGDRNMVKVAQAQLKEVAKKYPASIVGTDAAVALPFKDSSFDVVFSHLGLPGYSRNPREVATSLLEMIRVAKERVVITGVNFMDRDLEGVHEFGTDGREFKMAYKKFLTFLVRHYGLKYRVIPRTPLMACPSFDFDVTGKLLKKIRNEKKLVIEEAERLKR